MVTTIKIHGGGREVGNLCLELKVNETKIALDYGMPLRKKEPCHFPVYFDAVVVSHPHIDHIGNLPFYVRKKEEDVVFGTPPTRDLTYIMLNVGLKIDKEEGWDPAFTLEDIIDTHKHWNMAWHNKPFEKKDVQLIPYYSGHTLGSAMYYIDANGKKIIFTSDINNEKTIFYPGAELWKIEKNPDVLIIESTYGDKVRKSYTETISELKSRIMKYAGWTSVNGKGVVFIPVFSLEKSQQLMKIVDEIAKTMKCDAYYLSRSGFEILQVYKKSLWHTDLSLNNIKFNQKIKEPAIVIASSGFCNGGPSESLLKTYAPREDCAIIVPAGYVAPDTPLGMAIQNRSVITEKGEKEVKAKIERVELSSHADQKGLLEIINTINPKKVILVHGEKQAAEALNAKLKDREVHIPNNKESIEI
ncbi:MAG: MBL fold metallo-hydrolase [Candidatus Parvarchaeota archaeon]|nr:MBL fold metallo-hydrolase [Candidatus Jingweiarchaeum tengchongense]MCW1310532.1 MBL fold metallo-hydrolase [Candidatus Jingweiarchaeum tengchongense]